MKSLFFGFNFNVLQLVEVSLQTHTGLIVAELLQLSLYSL